MTIRSVYSHFLFTKMTLAEVAQTILDTEDLGHYPRIYLLLQLLVDQFRSMDTVHELRQVYPCMPLAPRVVEPQKSELEAYWVKMILAVDTPKTRLLRAWAADEPEPDYLEDYDSDLSAEWLALLPRKHKRMPVEQQSVGLPRIFETWAVHQSLKDVEAAAARRGLGLGKPVVSGGRVVSVEVTGFARSAGPRGISNNIL